MDSKPIRRRKSINLVLLIFIILIIITVIITTVYLINNSNEETNNKDDSTNKVSENIVNTIDNNIPEISNTETNSIPDFNDFDDINNTENVTPTATQSNNISFNNRELHFDNSVHASIVHTNNKPELELIYDNLNFKITACTDKVSYESLKTNQSVKNYLESAYNISINSPIKSGTINNLDIIVCTISDSSTNAYFIITPLNDSEILYSKIYNTSNAQSLVDDLSKPLDEISSLLSKLKN